MNNVVRTTIEAMAAVFGGTQSLHTNALDEAIALPTETSARIARNTQLVLLHETGIPDVIDPWAGSYAIEALTDEFYQKAGDVIREVEEEYGGMVQAIKKGMPGARIEASASKRQARIDSGQEVVVGVNKYTLENEDLPDVRVIDNERVRGEQMERMARVKGNRDRGQVEMVLNALREGCSDDSKNLLELSVNAAKARCTVGEITSALESKWGRHRPRISLAAPGTYLHSLRNADQDKTVQYVIKKCKEFEERRGRRPRMLVAKLGQDGHDRGAKIIASAFADLGFDVEIGPLFQTPEEVAKQALDADVHVVGISSLTAGHRTLVPALHKELQALYKGEELPLLALGGVIPEVDHERLRKESGVALIIGPGTPVAEVASKVIDSLFERNK